VLPAFLCDSGAPQCHRTCMCIGCKLAWRMLAMSGASGPTPPRPRGIARGADMPPRPWGPPRMRGMVLADGRARRRGAGSAAGRIRPARWDCVGRQLRRNRMHGRRAPCAMERAFGRAPRPIRWSGRHPRRSRMLEALGCVA